MGTGLYSGRQKLGAGVFQFYLYTDFRSSPPFRWNLALGKRPPQLKYDGVERPKSKGTKTKGKKDAGETVEDRINALADALGMPSRDLASAIAGAVKQYVPPASLSSVAAHQTGEAVDVLLKSASESDGQTQPQKDAEGAGGVVGGIASGMGSFVGMDEP
jgi:hypothetical protein